MITISEKLRVPAEQEGQRKKMLSQLKKWRPSMRTLYCVTLPQTEGSVLEVIPVFALRLEAKAHDITVFAVAEGRANAVKLVEEMLGEVYRETGGFDVKSYYSK